MIFNCGIDWLTLTNIVNGETFEQSLLPVFDGIADVAAKWSAGGYKGRQDPDSGIKYGSRLRKDGQADEIIILPGDSAGVALEVISDPLSYRATRIDFQVTVLLENGWVNLASDWYGLISDAEMMGEGITKRRKATLVKSSTGQTLYLGSRKTGRKFFRVYDKSKDAGSDLGLIWRQEIQYGRDLAQEALERYLNIEGDRYAIIALVCAEFQDAMGLSLHDQIGHQAEVISRTKPEKPTLSAKLEWLETCVKPTISLMIDNDLQAEMMQALGLEQKPRWTTDDVDYSFDQAKN